MSGDNGFATPETQLTIEFEMCDGVQNEFSFDIDLDVFILALAYQLIRNAAEDAEGVSSD